MTTPMDRLRERVEARLADFKTDPANELSAAVIETLEWVLAALRDEGGEE